MEDSVICTGLYAYSFRLDRKQEQLFQEIEWLINQPDLVKYLFKREFGDQTGKEHIQGIIWFSKRQSIKEILRMRNHFRREKGKISFISAKKVISLASYCNKTEGDLQTNLTPQEFLKIPDWRNKKDEWKEKLNIFLTKLKSKYYCNNYGGFCEEIVTFYLENEKSPPNRQILFKHLLKYHENYNTREYLQDINLFQNQF